MLGEIHEEGLLAPLRTAVETGFQTIPAGPAKNAAMYTAEVLGLAPSAPPAQALPIANGTDMLAALQAATERFGQLPPVPSEPQMTAMRSEVERLCSTVKKMPTSELRATPELARSTVDALSKLSGQTADLHERLKKEYGLDHPSTALAVEARLRSSKTQWDTTVRIIRARFGAFLFNKLVGPFASAASNALNFLRDMRQDRARL